MSSSPSSSAAAVAVFRVDKFAVPATAMQAFMARVQRTQQALHALPGCRQNLVMTQTGGPGEFNVVTIVEWVSEAAVAGAHMQMKSRYADEGFDPATFMRELGIRADIGTYRLV